MPVTVDGQTRMWRGHQFSYLWHQGHVFGPRAVGCALLSLEKWLYLLMDENLPLEEHLVTILRESRSIALAAVLICVGKRKPELFLGPLRPMAEAIDFYWIEGTIGRNAEGGFRASTFFELSSETLRGIWREWVQMPHRSEPIGQLALRMFLGNSEWREIITEFRVKWQARLDAATAEHPAPLWLPNIESQFDLENWRAERSKAGILIRYEPPIDLPQPSEDDLERMKRMELLTLLPFQCRQVLMGENECSEEQISEWWSQLETVRALPPQSEESGFRDTEDALCGIVAVAVVRHRTWLAADPSREEDALSILASVGAKPPKRFWLVYNDITDSKWDNFLAWALTTLWCDNPDDPFLLQAVGVLALWERNLVASRVMAIASEHRVELGEHFGRLLAHTIRYAPARHQEQMERHVPEKTFDGDAWVATHLERFVAGKTEPLPTSWRDLAVPQKRRGGKSADSGRGFDIGHIFAVLSWAEDLSKALDATERRRWLDFHRETLLCTLTRIEENIAAPPDREPYYDHSTFSPYEDERKVLFRIASLVARMAPGENHREFWEPIFALGCDGENWVTPFISHWMLEAAGHDEPSASLTEQWLAMLSYAERAPEWNSRSRHRPSSREIWETLLGFSMFASDFWGDKLAPAVEAVHSARERWARSHVNNKHGTRTYIRFLKSRAARRLRIDGLKLLHERVPIADRFYWDCSDTKDSFAGFLRLLFEENWDVIRGDPAAKDAFMEFSLKLSALQHPLGGEVLARAAARMGER